MWRGGRFGRAPYGRIGEVGEDDEEVQTSDFGLSPNSEFEESSSCSSSSSSSRIPIVSQSDQQNKLVAGHRSLCGHGIPMLRGRAPRRGRGRFQTSDFGLNTVDYHQLTRISSRPAKQVLGWCSSCELCPGCETFFRRGYW